MRLNTHKYNERLESVEAKPKKLVFQLMKLLCSVSATNNSIFGLNREKEKGCVGGPSNIEIHSFIQRNHSNMKLVLVNWFHDHVVLLFVS